MSDHSEEIPTISEIEDFENVQRLIGAYFQLQENPELFDANAESYKEMLTYYNKHVRPLEKTIDGTKVSATLKKTETTGNISDMISVETNIDLIDAEFVKLDLRTKFHKENHRGVILELKNSKFLNDKLTANSVVDPDMFVFKEQSVYQKKNKPLTFL